MRGSDMQRGYALANIDLDKVVCIKKDKSGFHLTPISNLAILNKALCFNNITAAKTIQTQIKDFDPDFPEIKIVNVAQLYNKFM